jgi:hypothetical protein
MSMKTQLFSNLKQSYDTKNTPVHFLLVITCVCFRSKAKPKFCNGSTVSGHIADL